jgi:hypothetical protein
MRVFNVTPATDVEYRGRMIPSNGGYVDVPDPIFIPERDLQLERDRILAFHTLPSWFVQKQETAGVAQQTETTPALVYSKVVAEPEALEAVLEPTTLRAEESAPKKNRK